MVRYLSRHAYIHPCAHADPYTHKYKYVFLSFMSFLLKRARASDVSDRPDITRARRRRINTRYVHSCPLFLSLSLSLHLRILRSLEGLSSCLSSCPHFHRVRVTSLTSVCLTSSSPPRPDLWIRSTWRD